MNLLVPNKIYEAVQCSFQNGGHKTPGLKNDKLLYIVSVLYNDSLTNENALDVSYDGAPLSAKIFKSLLSNSYKLHVDFLTNYQIIILNRTYLVGSHCNMYVINPNLIDFPIWHTITDFTFKKRLRSHYSRIEKKAKRLFPYLIRWFDSLEIDQTSAKQFIQQEYCTKAANPSLWDMSNSRNGEFKCPKLQFDHACRILQLFEQRKFNFSTDNSGYRFHTILTRCNKNLRKFITYKGAQLVSIDLRNSQPYLLLLLTDSEFLKSDLFYLLSKGTGISYRYLCSIILPLSSEIQYSKEFQRFKNEVANGTLYEYFGRQLSLTDKFPIAKDIAKKRVMVSLYSKKGTKTGGAKTVFHKQFPLIYQIIKRLKEKKYQNVAILLQRIESFLILQVICKRIAVERPDLPVFTIHDSIVTTVSNENYVRSVIEDELIRFIGVKPNVTLEYWNFEKKTNEAALIQACL